MSGAGFHEVQVVVLGCGAVGLPLAVAFAEHGFEVLGIDTDRLRVAMLSDVSVEDPEIAKALKDVVAGGRISFARSLASGSRRRAFIITVPTPVDAANRPVLANVEDAFRTAAAHAHDGDLIIIRSTVPIGTTRRLAGAVLDDRPGLLIAACPDRSVAGDSLAEQSLVPNVVGGMDRTATDNTTVLFTPLGPVVPVSSPEAAEAVKLFCNVQRDTIFALANQFALISEELGLDASEIAAAASGGYPRFLPTRPGPVGGPCLSKDSYLLAHSLSRNDKLAGLALVARQVNSSLLDHAAKAVAAFLPKATDRAAAISVVGLAFKGVPEITDRRGSFGVDLVERLRRDLPAAEIREIDPASHRSDMATLDRIAGGADVVVFANDHATIGALDLGHLAAVMRPNGTIYDLCRVNRPNGKRLPNGVRYRAFGDGAINQPPA